MLFVSYLASFCLAFCTKTQRVLHQNALRFAPKQTAFCTKTHRVLHQNALNLARNSPKTSTNCDFMQCVFILLAFTTHHFLHQNKPPRESIFCGVVGNWWAERALIMLKFLLKTRQNNNSVVCTHMATAQKTRTLTTASASGCRA